MNELMHVCKSVCVKVCVCVCVQVCGCHEQQADARYVSRSVSHSSAGGPEQAVDHCQRLVMAKHQRKQQPKYKV